MDKYFLVRREGKIEGPFEEQFLISMAKQGKLLPTDELAESQDGPWEIAKTHPVVIAAKPKKKNTIKVDEYKILTRKASEGYYDIRYWCPKCSTTIIIDEEEALKDYRCPACGIPTAIVDEAFAEIEADREERQRKIAEKERLIAEKERLKEERHLAREDRLKQRKEALTKLASATTAAAKKTAETASSVASNTATVTAAIAKTTTTLAKEALEEAAKPENIASRTKAMAEGVGYVKEQMERAKHTVKSLTDSESSKTFRQKLWAVFLAATKVWAVFLAATKVGQPRKQRVADAVAKEKEQQMRRLERGQESWAQGLGTVAVIIGIVITANFYLADTTVDTETTFGRVHNIGLMSRQRNGILLGLGLSAVGVVLLAVHYCTMASGGIKFDRRLDRLCPKCGEPIKKMATLCRHCNSEIEKDIDF